MALRYSAPKELKLRHVCTTNAKCAGTSYRVRGLHNRNLCLNGEQTSQLLRHSCLASAIYITHDGNERNVTQLNICVLFSSTEIITWLKIFRLLCIIDNAIRLLISDKR